MDNARLTPGKTRGRRVGAVEVLLVVAFAALALSITTSWPPTFMLPAEIRDLARSYGPSRNSQYYEEWIVRDFFKDRREGFFVDVGANHYRTFSNTYYLETKLGWSGIAIEPLNGFEPEYREYRPRTRFRTFFVSDVSNHSAKMYLLANGNHLVSSADRTFTQRFGAKTEVLDVPTITLNDLLDAEKVNKIDFISIDIELHEPKALAGFDIGRFTPALVCIEAHPEVRQQIIDYFTEHGYAVVGKYLHIDIHNLYFRPLDVSRRARTDGD
jgi:FkbM family methyltransferase